MQHSVLLGLDSWMRFEQHTYTILPRQPPQSAFRELFLTTLCTDGLSTFIHDNRLTTDTFHLELACNRTISLPLTPSLMPVNKVRSSGVSAFTGHYLVDMRPRDGLSSENETFVADSYQTILLSGFTDLEPGTLPGTSSSPLIQILTSAFHDPSTKPLPTPHNTDVHALHHNIPVASNGLPSTDCLPTPKTPCPKLLECLRDDQRTSFLRLWDQPPLHLRDITFNLHGSGWSPSVITALGDVLCEFPGFFSMSKTDFGSFSLTPFKISIRPDSTPVFPDLPHQRHTRQTGRCCTRPVRGSRSDPALNFSIRQPIGQLPIPRVDEILDSVGKGRIFSVFDVTSSFHLTIDKDTIPLTASCTPTRLVEWIVMSQGNSAAPGWFGKVINELSRNSTA